MNIKKPTNKNFLEEASNVLRLLFQNEQEAERVFNETVYPRYSELIKADKLGIDETFLFHSVDNYFNNESMKILGVAPSKQDLVAEYQDIAGHSLFEEETTARYIPDSEDN